jgi:short-subunit dehydrogenase
MLAEGRGTIVTVSSVLGHLGAANLSAYCASKAALLALHQSLRAELSQTPDAEEIKTILVQPGQMSTKMFENVHAPSKFFGPVVTPAEMAQGIIKLVERGESGEVALPLYSRYIQVLGCLPFGIQHIMRRWSGLDTAVEVGAGALKKKVEDKK